MRHTVALPELRGAARDAALAGVSGRADATRSVSKDLAARASRVLVLGYVAMSMPAKMPTLREEDIWKRAISMARAHGHLDLVERFESQRARARVADACRDLEEAIARLRPVTWWRRALRRIGLYKLRAHYTKWRKGWRA